ncbi:MAG: MmgE/PrpD family protein [Rhizobiaceae bacterium]|nr:MmgE/PrpD family protein [Rhizobiaceae bacterium]
MAKAVMDEFATFAASADDHTFPLLARSRAIDAIIDCIGCMLAGVDEPCAKNLREIMAFGKRAATLSFVPGAGYTAAPEAALCNGTAAHALDYDDTNHPAYAHPSAVLVPALLAISPLADARGTDIVSSYIVGFDLIGKLGRVLNTGHYAKGWHSTNTFGAVAAALACARLLCLPAEKISIAMGIAASGASGVRANFGTMVKPLHAGLAAQTGVRAALLARAGYDAAEDAFMGKAGYLAAFRGEGEPQPGFLSTPGEPLEILTDYGLALKPYPSCGATHPGIEAGILLNQQLFPRGNASGDLRRVRIGVARMALNPLIHHVARTPLQGKFCLEYCVAAALVEGRVDLSTFSPEKITDQAIQAVAGNTTMVVDERVAESPEFSTVVLVETNAGRVEEILVPLAKGKPERWMSRAERLEKFQDCIAYARGTTPKDLFEQFETMDSDIQVEALISTLRDHLTP